MFVDEVKINLIAGKGGDGCTSFRREKYVDMGGPNGGNGGKGADIIFEVDEGLKTLIDLKMMKTIKGEKGVNGKGSSQNGANAKDIVIKIPSGTTLTDLSTNTVIADLLYHGESFTVAHGGRGGRGNKAFATHDNPAPKMSELGEPGEIKTIKCELKVLADVGLVGFPSVGKSTLINQISNAKSKVGAYHFTTLSPNLGVVKYYEKAFVVADLPGLIEGASEGVGLGHQFLRHAMRTKIIAHVIDMSGEEGRNPIDDYDNILKELENYDHKLLLKRHLIIANKMDLSSSKENLKLFKEKYKDEKIFEISALNNEGIEPLIEYMAKLVSEIEDVKLYEDIKESHVLYQFKEEKPFTITFEDGIWVLKGNEIEKLLLMTRFEEEESVMRFGRKLKNMGVDDELLKLGAKKGDEVKILDYIFQFQD